MSMKERVAKSILDYDCGGFSVRDMLESFYANKITEEVDEPTKKFISELGLELARAAIEATKEP